MSRVDNASGGYTMLWVDRLVFASNRAEPMITNKNMKMNMQFHLLLRWIGYSLLRISNYF